MADTNVIEARVERVIFQNDGGWTVAAITVGNNGHEEPYTAVGVMPGLHAGMEIKAQAEPTHHPTYGDQLKIHSYTTHAPTTTEGMVIFLQEMVWGIGPALAARIVEHYGAQTETAMSDPRALQEVAGIGAGRAEDIAASWKEHESEREALEGILTFLVTNGLTTSYTRRIFDLFGFGAAETIRENPYELTRIRGIGFKKADQIALALGFAEDSPYRVRAAITYQANHATLSGHCYTPRDRLLWTVVDELIRGLPRSMAEEQLDHILAQDYPPLIQDGDAVYPWQLHQAETAVAHRITALCAGDAQHFLGNYTPTHTTITYTAQQQAAIRAAFEQKVSIITGGPGTGKTTLTRAIVDLARQNDKSIMLMSPTGKAAKRLSEATGADATTIHRALGSRPGSNELMHDRDFPWPADLILVDEASMLDIRLTKDLLNATPDHANLILVGDADQLPSVGPGNVLRDLIAVAETDDRIHTTRLQTIHRQARDSRIVTNAHRINQGGVPEFDTGAGGDFYLFTTADAASAADRIVDLVESRIPRAFGIDPADIQVLTPIHRGAAGDNALNERLQEVLNPPDSRPTLKAYAREFRTGDRVIQTRNDYDRQVFNGDIGTIQRIGKDPENKDTPTAWIEIDGRLIPYPQKDIADLRHAYALTIHKSQGSEFPAVVVPMLTQHYIMLQRNLIYTAITRARQLVVLVGNHKAIGIAVTNNDVQDRNTMLRGRIHPAKVTNDTYAPQANPL